MKLSILVILAALTFSANSFAEAMWNLTAVTPGTFKSCGESNDDSEALRQCIWTADDRCKHGAKAVSGYSTTQSVVTVDCGGGDDGTTPSQCNEVEYKTCATFTCK